MKKTKSVFLRRMNIISAITALMIFLFFAFIAVMLQKQRYDGIRINLSGRQRMLIQKLSKEVMLYSQGKIDIHEIEMTMKVFDLTLKGLAEGGEVPTDIKMEQVRRIPAMNAGPVREKLGAVLVKWEEFRLHCLRYLEKADPDSFIYIINENISLLVEMDDAVKMMEEESEERTLLMQFMVFSAVFITISALAYMLVVRIRQVKEAREEILKLQRILPICASCKRIRGANSDPYDQHSWLPLEEYLKMENDINFSHGLCPECAGKLYPGLIGKK